MAGGTWARQNKVRPGVYIRFRTINGAALQIGERGVVAICEPMSWGPVGTVMQVAQGADTTPFCGYPITDPNALFLHEIFKGTDRTTPPYKVLLYRPAATGATTATANLMAEGSNNGLVINALYPGTRGNGIVIIVTADPDNAGTFEVATVVDNDIVDQQTVTAISDLVPNAWVSFAGTGNLTATSGVTLSGGTNGTIAESAYADALTAFEPYYFDILIYDGSNSVTQLAFQKFVERMANENGSYGQLVTANMEKPDSRFVINVNSGVVLKDGTTSGTSLTPQQTCWWVGGAEAGAQYNESLTYAEYPDAMDVTPKMANSDYIAALQAGELVLAESDGSIKIEQDINSLVTYTPDIGKVYHKNRVMRLCNTIANDLYRQFSAYYIGVVNNNEQGRTMFKSAIVDYMLGLQAQEAIQNFSAADVTVERGNDIDSIIVNLTIQAVDSIEKIYMAVEVS